MKLCKNCFVIYSGRSLHSCEGTCSVCHNDQCRYEGSSVTCKDCNMYCRNAVCFDRHKIPRKFKAGPRKDQSRPSLCENYHKCTKCGKRMDVSERPLERHVCGERFCRSCAEYVVGEHYCYHRVYKPKDGNKNARFLFFDVETTQNEVNECPKGYRPKPVEGCDRCTIDNDGVKCLCNTCRRCKHCKNYQCGLHEHHPCFIVAQSSCNVCQDDTLTPATKCFHCGTRCPNCWKLGDDGNYVKQPCDNNSCGFREVVFSGFDCGQRFGEFLFNEGHKNFTVIAHNSKGFDSMFILNYCINNSVFPNLVYSGSKIMYMKVADDLNIRLIDSLNFLPFRLKDFNKALDLPCNVKKYDFPQSIMAWII